VLYSRRTSIALIFCLTLLTSIVHAGMVINAGAPQTVCKGDSVVLGGNPTVTGGTAPYTFSWSPTTGMNNPADSNPHVKVTATTWYYLTVTDFTGGRQIDSVLITVDNIALANAGRDTSICPYSGVANLGGSGNQASFTYSWTPATGLSCNSCPTTTANPTSTTTYTLIASDGICKDTTQVTVTVLPPIPLTTITPVTVNSGQTVTLTASGASTYFWEPTASLYNPTSATPEAYPNVTTTYTVYATGPGPSFCQMTDTVEVIVKNDSDLVFYNTFTPNNDGINDTWYIGNIFLYPNSTVTIFNRYGKQVYFAYGYSNQWDGTSLGANLPDATYYYVVTTGTGRSYRGSVTILRKPQ
jgi:gliding motility-associated-like protein